MKKILSQVEASRPVVVELFRHFPHSFTPAPDAAYYREKNPVWFQFVHMEFQGFFAVHQPSFLPWSKEDEYRRSTFIEVYGTTRDRVMNQNTHFEVAGMTCVVAEALDLEDPESIQDWLCRCRPFVVQTLRKHRKQSPVSERMSGVQAEALCRNSSVMTHQQALKTVLLLKHLPF